MSTANINPASTGDILIVDDTQSDLKLLTDILRKAGYTVRPASDGELALRSVQARLPELILLDIKMPGMDGYEVCRRLKDSEDTRDIPVIFISVKTSPIDKVKAFALGGVDYITKPFEPEEVLARVATHLALRKSQKEIEEKNLQLQQEIAERVQAEKVLRESEERFRQVYEHMAVGVARIPMEFRIESGHEGYCRMLGYHEEELIGKHLRDITHPDIVEENLRKQSQLAAGEIDHYRMEKQFIHKSGRVVTGILDANLVRDAEGKPLYFLGSVVDITERKQADAALRNSEERLARAVEGNSIPTFLIDSNHIITHWNKACKNLTGISAAEILGTRKAWSAFYAEERPVLADLIVNEATEKEIAKYYEGKYNKSVLIEGAYEGENFGYIRNSQLVNSL